MMRQIVFDTETTGMCQKGSNPAVGHRVIELGCVEIIDRQITGNQLHCYFNPDRKVDEEAIKVHGIDDNFLSDKPSFADCLPEILNFFQGADEIIAHNMRFDQQFMDQEFALCHETLFSQRYTLVDTLQMARKRFPNAQNNLDALCKRLGVNNAQRTLHGALLDAQILAEVYLKLTGGQVDLLSNISAQSTQESSQTIATLDNDWLVAHALKREIEQHEQIIQKF